MKLWLRELLSVLYHCRLRLREQYVLVCCKGCREEGMSKLSKMPWHKYWPLISQHTHDVASQHLLCSSSVLFVLTVMKHVSGI